MRHLPRALLAGGLGFAMSLIAGCGGGAGLLSSDQAGNLNSQLDQVSSAVAAGHCDAARNAASSFSQAVFNLPSTISGTLKTDLGSAANTISQLVPQKCHQAAATTNTATTATNTTSTTQTTHTVTTTAPTTNTVTQPSTASSGGGGLGGGVTTGGGILPGGASGNGNG
jgi:hypothetical protein